MGKIFEVRVKPRIYEVFDGIDYLFYDVKGTSWIVNYAWKLHLIGNYNLKIRYSKFLSTR